jgi:hypothetical protein
MSIKYTCRSSAYKPTVGWRQGERILIGHLS